MGSAKKDAAISAHKCPCSLSKSLLFGVYKSFVEMALATFKYLFLQ
jgi:hypothetical protein